MWTERKLRNLAQKLLVQLKVRGAILDIFLLPNRDIKILKAKFIKKKTEPNVLSFTEPLHFPHPETRKKYLGEIYLNEDILKKNPGRAAPLLLHGILHLLGRDHETKREREEMEGLERKILENATIV